MESKGEDTKKARGGKRGRKPESTTAPPEAAEFENVEQEEQEDFVPPLPKKTSAKTRGKKAGSVEPREVNVRAARSTRNNDSSIPTAPNGEAEEGEKEAGKEEKPPQKRRGRTPSRTVGDGEKLESTAEESKKGAEKEQKKPAPKRKGKQTKTASDGEMEAAAEVPKKNVKKDSEKVVKNRGKTGRFCKGNSSNAEQAAPDDGEQKLTIIWKGATVKDHRKEDDGELQFHVFWDSDAKDAWIPKGELEGAGKEVVFEYTCSVLE